MLFYQFGEFAGIGVFLALKVNLGKDGLIIVNSFAHTET